jgi:peroxiredoxin Q/BCP
MSQTPANKNARALAEGDFAPDFVLATDGGGEVDLSKLRGKNVVVYFYPKDDTPGCTVEAKDFRDRKEDFDLYNTVIIGVSKDSVESHNAFKDKYYLPFVLAADEDGTVVEAYDVCVEKNMYGKKYMGIQRDTFLINEEGKIAKIWHKVKVDGHAEEVLEAVKDLERKG